MDLCSTGNSSPIKNKNSLKRKAESPRLHLELQTVKRAKLPPSKTLQTLLTSRLDYADHIKVKYSQRVNTDFLNTLRPVNRNASDGSQLKIAAPQKVHKKPEEYDGSEIMAMLTSALPSLTALNFKTITAKDLDLKYSRVFPPQIQGHILERLENEIVYISESEAKVKVFGKWFPIPRKQVAFGDSGLTYKFSGKTVKALDWTPLTRDLLNIVNKITNSAFNFVLINRYKDGKDHIGEHRDDEVDLDLTAPIASLSFGAARDFVLRHKDLRSKKAKIDPITVKLESGSLLLMNPPTNLFWYHSIPVRKTCHNLRINLTFRKIGRKK